MQYDSILCIYCDQGEMFPKQVTDGHLEGVYYEAMVCTECSGRLLTPRQMHEKMSLWKKLPSTNKHLQENSKKF